jgi:regulator of sirC expression with transglutaminase-like and TPR domain
MDSPAEATERFRALLRLDEGDLPLDEAAFLIAAHAMQDVDVDLWLDRLDELARRCVPAAGDATALAEVMTRDLGFRGNTIDYTDPRNSLLPEVIDRRLGIPITLSVLMIELGRRVGIRLHGVGMPGHFLVGVDHEPGTYIDVFHDGAVLDIAGCRALFEELYGTDMDFSAALLAPTGSRSILLRMLNNLERTFESRRSPEARWVARLRLCFPGLPSRERERTARVLASVGAFDEAASALEELAPEVAKARSDALLAEARALRAQAN